MKRPSRCERCGESLHPERIVWLELSQTDGEYYQEDNYPIPEDHVSQGLFPFGKACAKKQINETKKDNGTQ